MEIKNWVKYYTIDEVQEMWTQIIKKNAEELRKDLIKLRHKKESRIKNSNLSYV